MRKVISLLISFGLIFTAMLNLVYAMDDNENNVEQINDVVENNNEPHVFYNTYVQDSGWTSYVNNGAVSGTTGQSKRLEAIKIGINNLPYEGSIEYSTHIEDYGWQNYVNNEEISGTIGESKRIEAIKIRLTGEISNYYDVYYRVHIQDYGWLDWAKNNQKAGSESLSLRLEAIEIELVKKDNSAPGDKNYPFVTVGNISYAGHVEDYGWMYYVSNGEISGTVEESKRLEAIKISLGKNIYVGNIEYSTHVEDYGWLDYVSNGAVSGTTGESKKIEAIKIRLTGEISNYYDVYYRVYCQNIGWLDWTSNDKVSGTIGGSFGLEAIQIKLYPKKANKPIETNKSSLIFSDRNGFKVCYDAKGNICEDLEKLIGLQESYELRVNKQTNVVTVLIQNGEGEYEIAYKRFICSVGNDTPTGTFYTPAKYRWRALVESSYGQYSTRIVNRILFHSVPYDKMNPYTLLTEEYNKLGTTCSHGCVRLTCEDAKWIYDNCALKTKVEIVTRRFDPLNKPKIQKIPSSQTWDPTDSNI